MSVKVFSQNNEVCYVYSIVNNSLGNKIIKFLNQYEVLHLYSFIGMGSVNNHFLNFLSIYEEKKEIIVSVIKKHDNQNIIKELDKRFCFHKPHTGIAFSVCINKIGEEETCMHNLLHIVVERGKAQEVIDSARKKGAKGATIVHGKDAKNIDDHKLFKICLNKEKEVVLMVLEKNIVAQVIEQIKQDFQEEFSDIIIFKQDIEEVSGILK